MQAMNKALQIVKERGIEALEEDLKMRGATKMPLTISSAKGVSWMKQASKDTIDTVLLMALSVLHDEFGFGEKRLNRFMDRYALKTECMGEGYVCWEDLQDEMKEKFGFELKVSDLLTGHRGVDAEKQRLDEIERLRGD